MSETNEAVIDKTDIKDDEKLEEPKDYCLVFLNDNFSSFELVEQCLTEICHKSREEAEKITLQVHKEGKGIGYIGTYDICITKKAHIETVARMFGMPLKVVVEEQ